MSVVEFGTYQSCKPTYGNLPLFTLASPKHSAGSALLHGLSGMTRSDRQRSMWPQRSEVQTVGHCWLNALHLQQLLKGGRPNNCTCNVVMSRVFVMSGWLQSAVYSREKEQPLCQSRCWYEKDTWCDTSGGVVLELLGIQWEGSCPRSATWNRLLISIILVRRNSHTDTVYDILTV